MPCGSNQGTGSNIETQGNHTIPIPRPPKNPTIGKSSRRNRNEIARNENKTRRQEQKKKADILNFIHIWLLFYFGWAHMEILSALPIPPETPAGTPPGVLFDDGEQAGTRPRLQMSCNTPGKTQAEQTPRNFSKLLLGKPSMVGHLCLPSLPSTFASDPAPGLPRAWVWGCTFFGEYFPTIVYQSFTFPPSRIHPILIVFAVSYSLKERG